MRRSLAPSLRKIDLSSINKVNSPSLSTSTSLNAQKLPLKEQSNCPTTSAKDKKCRFYNVVWGRRTSKKHKTYDDDGILEVSDKTATLRDANGKYVATTQIKPEEIEIGLNLICGSNELEIIEEIDQPVVVKKPKLLIEDENTELSRVKSKPANPSCFTPSLVITNSLAAATPTKPMNFNLLGTQTASFKQFILPSPPPEHQAKFNKTNSPIVEVCVTGCLAKELRPHQQEGVVSLYECLMGYRDPENWGCILADEMGLGKTLQCITVCYTMLTQGPYGQKMAKKILIVTPSSLVDNWDTEITKWLGHLRAYTFQIDVKHKIEQYAQSHQIPFLLISYEMFAKNFEKLKSIKFDVIICDEGHRLKNAAVQAAILLQQIDCKRRCILTGTPIQNDLQEFFALIDFVNPNILGSYQEFKKNYELPILRSQQPDTLPCVRELGEQKAIEFNQITAKFILRRTDTINRKYLPKKQEFVVFCLPSQLQQSLVKAVLQFYENEFLDASKLGISLKIINFLKKICNHPSLLSASLSDDTGPDSLSSYLLSILPAWNEMGPFDSGKLAVAYDLLQQMHKGREKVLVISYSTKTLDMFEGLLDHLQFTHCRIDGKTAANSRCQIVSDFNDPKKDLFVCLLSSKAGGVGLNLIGASRLLLYDNDWNPASDLQAMARIWRDGQKRDVYIYRLITSGTIEEKIFQRQISKTSLGGCIIDKKVKKSESIRLSEEDLKDLFSIQETFDNCATHDLLNCECLGNGEKCNTESPLITHIDLLNKESAKTIKMHELVMWEHYKSPVDPILLREMAIPNSADEVVFIFRNQNNI